MATVTVKCPCKGCDEADFYGASTTFSGNFTSTSYPYTRMCDDGQSNNYARFNVNKTAGATSYMFLEFDCSAVPEDAIITNVDGFIRLYSTGSGSYCSSRQIRWCLGNGDNWMRFSQNFSTSSNPTYIEVDDLKSNFEREDLDNIKCYVHYTRSSYTSNTQYYIYIYGAYLSVTYEMPSSDNFYIKQNEVWNPVLKIYLKENGIWTEQSLSYLSDNNITYLLKGN